MRRTVVLTCGAVAALALAACGPTTQSGAPAAGPAGSEPARSAQFANIADLASAVGSSSRSKQSAHLTTEVTTPQGVMKGRGVYRQDASGVAAEMTTSTPQGETQTVVVPGTVYLRMPQAQQLTGGKPWIKITQGGQDPVSQAFGGLLNSVQQQADVTKAIDRMRAAGTITGAVPERVDGVDTTHYSIKVDVAKLAATEQDPTLKQAYQTLQRGTPTLTNELWLNRDNLPVRLVTDNVLNGQPVKAVADYTGWGEPVQINEPPADQVGQFPAR